MTKPNAESIVYADVERMVHEHGVESVMEAIRLVANELRDRPDLFDVCQRHALTGVVRNLSRVIPVARRFGV